MSLLQTLYCDLMATGDQNWSSFANKMAKIIEIWIKGSVESQNQHLKTTFTVL